MKITWHLIRGGGNQLDLGTRSALARRTQEASITLFQELRKPGSSVCNRGNPPISITKAERLIRVVTSTFRLRVRARILPDASNDVARSERATCGKAIAVSRPKMGRRWNRSCASLDKRHRPSIVWRNRRIVLNDTVAASNRIPGARSRGLLRDAVSNEPAVARVKARFAQRKFPESETPTKRSQPGWIAESCLYRRRASARFQTCALSPKEITSQSVQVFHESAHEPKVGYDGLPVVSCKMLGLR